VAHILVVESDPEDRLNLARGLEGDGHRVRLATNLEMAGDQLASLFTFDAVVANEHQSDGDGVAFLADLRIRIPGCARVLVGDQRTLSAMVRAVNTAAPHQVVHRDDPVVAKCAAVDCALLGVRSALDAARIGAPGVGREHLHRMLESSVFQLAVQPIISAEGGTFGYEGLIRTTDPALPTPALVLEMAERYGMLDHVLYAVASRARDLLGTLPAARKLFLNLHPLDLADPDELVRLLRPIEPFADRVALEITGRAHTRWTTSLRERLEPLRTQGFTIGIDDLGAGEGALVLMAESAPRFIKVHDSIVRGIVDSAHKLRILEMLCHFAVGSRARVIAEGVEREEEVKVLRSLGIPLFQGFLYGVPSVDPAEYLAH
jgi:EAL domain-containing protein (putative c-di-GMP-specific phosphodiesterase class I)/CheY-like chemotaxis protein